MFCLMNSSNVTKIMAIYPVHGGRHHVVVRYRYIDHRIKLSSHKYFEAADNNFVPISPVALLLRHTLPVSRFRVPCVSHQCSDEKNYLHRFGMSLFLLIRMSDQSLVSRTT